MEKDLNPGTPEWHSWRGHGIGSSDIATIMGTNPYQTLYNLWEIKSGLKEGPALNEAMRHGIRCEPLARAWMESHYDKVFAPKCFEDDGAPHFRASLDGWDIKDEIVLEIKSPSSRAILERAQNHYSVPPYWLDQVQWQLMVSGGNLGLLAVYDAEQDRCTVIDVMPSHIRHFEMRKMAAIFWTQVMEGAPPDLGSRDYLTVPDAQLKALMEDYGQTTKNLKRLIDRKEKLKQQILAKGPEDNFTCGGFRVQRQQVAGGIDLEAMRDAGIPVDDFRKSTSQRVRIYLPEESDREGSIT